MERERILQRLRDDVKAARKRFHDTEEYLDLAFARRASSNTPDQQTRFRLASRSYRIAGEELRAALSRLNQFVTEGIEPAQIQTRRPPQSERVRSIAARKSA